MDSGHNEVKNVVVEVLDQMSCAEEKWWLEWIVY